MFSNLRAWTSCNKYNSSSYLSDYVSGKGGDIVIGFAETFDGVGSDGFVPEGGTE